MLYDITIETIKSQSGRVHWKCKRKINVFYHEILALEL